MSETELRRPAFSRIEPPSSAFRWSVRSTATCCSVTFANPLDPKDEDEFELRSEATGGV
jgi:hypothetical protein